MHTFGVTWSSDSKQIASYSNWGNLITVWNENGSILKEIPREGDHYTGNALAFVRGNTQLAARPVSYRNGGDAVNVYDITTGNVVDRLPGPGRPDQWQPVNAARVLASSPNESLLAVIFGRAEYHPVALYSTSDWHKVADIGAPLETKAYIAGALAFSQDGRLLAIASPKDVQVFDIEAKTTIQTIKALNSADDGCCIEHVAFNKDSSQIAITNSSGGTVCCCTPGCLDSKRCCTIKPNTGPIRVFRVADGAGIVTYPFPVSDIFDMRWSPDGRFIAFITPGTLYLWSPSHPQEQSKISLNPDSISLAFAPDGRHLAVNDSQYVTIFKVID
ncbi:WD40 repeat domain-containing protein [Rhodopila sp.]|uniref:WD40 repeat domain-containing protein n=1 Tax=Rhodopila sp. TaxID=2480087 RepID=UPI003D0A057A